MGGNLAGANRKRRERRGRRIEERKRTKPQRDEARLKRIVELSARLVSSICPKEGEQKLERLLATIPAEIGISVRTTNCLKERDIFTVNDLVHCTPDDLLSIAGFGEKTLEEVYKALEEIGFHRPTTETLAFAVTPNV